MKLQKLIEFTMEMITKFHAFCFKTLAWDFLNLSKVMVFFPFLFPNRAFKDIANSSAVLSLRFLPDTWILNNGSFRGNVVDESRANFISAFILAFLIFSLCSSDKYLSIYSALVKGPPASLSSLINPDVIPLSLSLQAAFCLFSS